MSNFRRDLSFLTLGAVAAISVGLLLVRIALPMSSDDERPPVVVSDGGSIKIYAEDKADGTGHGYFHQEKGTDKKKFYHDHPYTEPTAFGVTIENYASCTSSYNGPYETKNVTIKYGESAGDSELEIKVKGFLMNGKYLAVNAKNEDFLPDGPFTLWLQKDNDKIRFYSVSFNGKDASGAAVNQQCSFDKKGGKIGFAQKK